MTKSIKVKLKVTCSSYFEEGYGRAYEPFDEPELVEKELSANELIELVTTGRTALDNDFDFCAEYPIVIKKDGDYIVFRGEASERIKPEVYLEP